MNPRFAVQSLVTVAGLTNVTVNLQVVPDTNVGAPTVIALSV